MRPDLSILNPFFKTNYRNVLSQPCPCSQTKPLPLSKTNNINTSTNNSAISCRMRYSQIANTFGTSMSSSSYPKKTCSIGGPTFSY
jgi:hypothetical protein